MTATKTILRMGLLALLTAVPAVLWAGEGDLRVWPVDVHEKVFTDAQPQEAGELVLSAAANEYESGQFGIWSEKEIENITWTVSDLTSESGAVISVDTVRLRPIEALPIEHNTPELGELAVRTAPAAIPDILSEETSISVAAESAAGIWVTIKLPEDAVSGTYTGTITLSAENTAAVLPVRLNVFGFALSNDRHLWVTNWFSIWNFAIYHDVEPFSEEYWAVTEKYFQNMADHRQNVIYCPLMPDGQFFKAHRDKEGNWSFDFSIMERYLSLAEKCGVGDRIEYSHFAWIERNSHDLGFHTARIFDENSKVSIDVSLNEWLEPTIKALIDWLEETGRLEKSMIHIADEPFQADLPRWRWASDHLHSIAPQLKRIEAIESTGFLGSLEVWVPKLSHYDRWQKEFDRMRTENPDIEMWYYICCHPFGKSYPNRFVDIPATRVRALHWINYTEHLDGYLHWGYNFWRGDAFGPPAKELGPGDTHAVYPGPLDSIRWEIERESLEDYEYFVLLEKLLTDVKNEYGETLWWLNPEERSEELAHRAVRSMTDVDLDPAVFEQARLDAAKEIESLTNGPRLIVRSFPGDNAQVITGPVVIEFYGLADPGAAVTADGKAVETAEDGTFIYTAEYFTAADVKPITFTAEKDGKTTETTRYFTEKP